MPESGVEVGNTTLVSSALGTYFSEHVVLPPLHLVVHAALSERTEGRAMAHNHPARPQCHPETLAHAGHLEKTAVLADAIGPTLLQWP